MVYCRDKVGSRRYVTCVSPYCYTVRLHVGAQGSNLSVTVLSLEKEEDTRFTEIQVGIEPGTFDC